MGQVGQLLRSLTIRMRSLFPSEYRECNVRGWCGSFEMLEQASTSSYFALSLASVSLGTLEELRVQGRLLSHIRFTNMGIAVSIVLTSFHSLSSCFQATPLLSIVSPDMLARDYIQLSQIRQGGRAGHRAKPACAARWAQCAVRTFVV